MAKTNYKSARKEFRNSYSGSAPVVELIARGWDTSRIAEELSTSTLTVAAVRANVTRGAYRPFVTGNTTRGFRGSCKF